MRREAEGGGGRRSQRERVNGWCCRSNVEDCGVCAASSAPERGGRKVAARQQLHVRGTVFLCGVTTTMRGEVAARMHQSAGVLTFVFLTLEIGLRLMAFHG